MNAKLLLSILMSQDFEDWYSSDLEAFICGEEDAKSKEQILLDLENFIKEQHT